MLSEPSQSRLRLPPLVGDSPLNPLEGSAPTVAFGVAPPPEEVNLSPTAQSDEQVEDCVEEFNEGEDLCAKTEGDKGLGRLESVKQILRAQSIKVLSKVAPYEPPKLGKGGLTLWRGMRDMKLEQKFHTNGGTEMAFMSTTSDMSVALKYSLSECSLFFKIVAKDFMVIGAELEWISAFPGEVEYCYPPLTYLRPTGRKANNISYNVNGRKLCFSVVEVEPLMA
mmetsp:Transcript_34136/g.83943  ORF Transcript_34136/g.83943 Transcript_34136/m.83943 type:complete len:224 (-) Transcript_34136:173-844(-)